MWVSLDVVSDYYAGVISVILLQGNARPGKMLADA
jgi:hypothetical protein